jgi:hypothetical protein
MEGSIWLSEHAEARRGERSEAASRLSIFRRLAPFPFARLPIVAGNAALDHFVAPAIACNNESDQLSSPRRFPPPWSIEE